MQAGASSYLLAFIEMSLNSVLHTMLINDAHYTFEMVMTRKMQILI